MYGMFGRKAIAVIQRAHSKVGNTNSNTRDKKARPFIKESLFPNSIYPLCPTTSQKILSPSKQRTRSTPTLLRRCYLTQLPYTSYVSRRRPRVQWSKTEGHTRSMPLVPLPLGSPLPEPPLFTPPSLPWFTQVASPILDLCTFFG
jgi:hypothetical protein